MVALVKSVFPLYYQLKEILREKIDSGEWKAGERLPSERELCETYNVSRATARQALADLVHQGIVERQQGRGTFVVGPKLDQDFLGFYSFTSDMQSRGLQPSLRVLSTEVVAAPAAIAGRLGLEPGARLIKVARVRLVNEEPVMLDACYLPEERFSGLLQEDLSGRLLHEVLAEEFGVQPTRQQKWVEPIIIDQFEAALLGVRRGVLGLLIERLTYDEGGRPVEFRRVVVRGDRCRYYVDVVKP